MKLNDKRYWILPTLLFATLLFAGCGGDCYLTDNYVIRTTGDGGYGESEEDYPILAGKLQAKEEPDYIPHVKEVWWNNRYILVEQGMDVSARWWLIKARHGDELSWNDSYIGAMTEIQKDSIVEAECLNLPKLKYKAFE